MALCQHLHDFTRCLDLVKYESGFIPTPCMFLRALCQAWTDNTVVQGIDSLGRPVVRGPATVGILTAADE